MTREISFTRLRILTEGPAAIALSRGSYISVDDCQISARALARALETADLARLMPLIYLDGKNLTIEHCWLRVPVKTFNRNRVALGGIQIGGRSQHVRIEDNTIEGGNGHGITLGSVVTTETEGKDGTTLIFPPWLTIDEDGCIKLYPGGTLDLPGSKGTTRYRSAGSVSHLRIRDNEISNHGGCGISVAHWFVPRERTGEVAAAARAGGDARATLDPGDTLTIDLDGFDGMDDIELEEVMIDDNRIFGCMQINLTSALPVEAAFNSGYGGITLSSAVDTTIDNNEIRGCGRVGRSPICGIYIRYAERLQINGNRISENGRPASITNPLLVGNIGGIVLSHVDGVEEGLGTQLREVAAAVISHNTVISPEGRALELLGSGQMLVQGNTLTSHGNNIGGVLLMLYMALLQQNPAVGSPLTSPQLEGQFRAAVSQIGGSAVLILNTGVNRNIALWGASASSFLGKGPPPAYTTGGEAAAAEDAGGVEAAFEGLDLASIAENVEAAEMSEMRMTDAGNTSLLSGFDGIKPARQRMLPRGPVSFSDNMVTFDALSDAITLSLSSIAILSFDDVGMHDNHCAMDLRTDFVLIDALVFGLASCRVVGNRFREILPLPRSQRAFPIPTTLFSAVTLGLLNATEMNQGTYCFLDLGWKKPQILLSGTVENPRAELDTNRHIIPDGLCARFRNRD